MKKKLIVAAVATSSLFAVPSLNDVNKILQSNNLVHKTGSLETLGAVWASRSLIPTIEKGLTPENKEKLDKVRGELISRSKIITLALEEFLKDHPEPLLKLRAWVRQI